MPIQITVNPLYLALLLCLALMQFPARAEVSTADWDQVLSDLSARDFAARSAAIEQLANSGHAASETLLKAILNGDLYYLKATGRLVYTLPELEKLRLFDAISREDLGLTSERKVKKVRINNKLREQLNTEIARLGLYHSDARQRRSAAQNLIGKADANLITEIKTILLNEHQPDVREALGRAVAFAALDSTDNSEQLEAIAVLHDNLDSEVLAKLKLLTASEDLQVKTAAQKAVKGIESIGQLYGWLETLVFGLSLGSILALAAIGLAITFGVMGVINMAHGELIMIGAYTTYTVQLLMPNSIGLSILVAIPAAFLVSALVGIAIELGVIRFLNGRPLETLLATFGISLFLQQTVRSIYSPLNRSVETPAWMSGSLEINPLLSITYNRLYIFIFCLLVFIALYLVMKKTSLGLQVRAVSQNRAMARAMGVPAERVDAMTFGLGSGIAGVAGVALSQITNVGPNLGQAYIVDSFMVVVFGGVGNLWGTLISGLSLGVLGKFLEPTVGAVLAKILVLIGIILFIQKRPRGLFPQRGRAAE